MMRLTTLVFVSLVAACSWGDGSGQEPMGDDGNDLPDTPICGDSECASSEVSSCPADCGGGPATNDVCGDGSCTGTETASTCPSDCSTGNPGGSGSNSACPADGFSCLACIFEPSLCPAGHDQASCSACSGLGSGGFPGGGDVMCTGGAPDGMCDQDEDDFLCPSDCP